MTDRLALSVQEAADALGVGRSVVYRMIDAGELTAVVLPTMTSKRIPMWSLRQLVGEPAGLEAVAS